MIWNDEAITKWAEEGGVTPFDEKLVNPASLDLRLGDHIRLPYWIWDTLTRVDLERYIKDGSIAEIPLWGPPLHFDEHWLMPQGKGVSFVLCSSLDFINMPDNMASLLFSKSSTGRIGLEHLHAGFGDPSWHSAQWTWELHNVAPWPIKLVAGKALMQQVMIKLTDAPLKGYDVTGRYNGQVGPTPERDSIPEESVEAAEAYAAYKAGEFETVPWAEAKARLREGEED